MGHASRLARFVLRLRVVLPKSSNTIAILMTVMRLDMLCDRVLGTIVSFAVQIKNLYDTSFGSYLNPHSAWFKLSAILSASSLSKTDSIGNLFHTWVPASRVVWVLIQWIYVTPRSSENVITHRGMFDVGGYCVVEDYTLRLLSCLADYVKQDKATLVIPLDLERKKGIS